MIDIETRLEDAERESRRLSKKILKFEKRLRLFDVHETEKLMNESYSYIKEIKLKFQLILTKVNIYEQLRCITQGQPDQFKILSNVIKKFDDEDRFWLRLDELTLEELERVFAE